MKYYHFKTISSTNDYALDLLKVDSPVIVTADHQWLARGRNYRQWYGDYVGNIYCSIAIKHTEPPPKEQLFIYYAIGTLASKYALKSTCSKDLFFIKYPNDILALNDNGEFKKIGGVLVENQENDFVNATVIGIGINIQQTEFPDDISKDTISLNLLGFDYSYRDVLNLLTNRLEQLLKTDFKTLFDIWTEELNLKNKIITVEGTKNIWKVESLNRDGTLTLVDENYNKLIINEQHTIRYNVYP